MISFLTGTIEAKTKHGCVVLTPGGVGYEIFLTPLQAAGCGIGQAVRLFTYLKVGENSMDLYGFETLEERSFFLLLLSVTGVGPKSAMNILSLGSIDDISAAIARGDVKYLTAVQGMGKKTAERMVVELKSKVISLKSKVGADSESELIGDVMGEVIEALVGMGYQKEDAKEMVKLIEIGNKKTEEVLKEVLRLMSR